MISEEQIVVRGRYFQAIQTWPLNDKLNYQGWLNNFAVGEERMLAVKLLNFFVYYNESMVDKLLMHSIGKAGNLLNDNNWDHSLFRYGCYYSTIPGENNVNQDPSGSGLLFLRKIKARGFGVPEEQIYNFNNLFEMLDQTRASVSIIFVDDFVGSGDQCVKAFQFRDQRTQKSLNDFAEEGKHKLIFAPTIINNIGYNKIRQSCPHLHLSYSHLLGDEYNLFHPSCLCWESEDEFQRGTSLIISKSREVGIPENGETGIKGYKEQGLALSFNHGTPDATIPLFYWNDNGWIPLIDKAYERNF